MIDAGYFAVFIAAGAAVLSLSQACAMAAPPRGWRYALAWSYSTVALSLAMLFLLGDRGEIPSAHQNVRWMALVLSALTTSVAFGLARLGLPPTVLQSGTLLRRARRFFPIHVGVLVVLGAVDMWILTMVFLSNIH